MEGHRREACPAGAGAHRVGAVEVEDPSPKVAVGVEGGDLLGKVGVGWGPRGQ